MSRAKVQSTKFVDYPDYDPDPGSRLRSGSIFFNCADDLDYDPDRLTEVSSI